MKKWTVETLVTQLRIHLTEAGQGDILDPMSGAADLSIGETVELLKDHAFRQKMAQIPGQTRINPTTAAIEDDPGSDEED